MRSLTKSEKIIILELANALPLNLQGGVKADLDKTFVEEETRDRSCLRLKIEGYSRPPYRGQHPYPVEGRMKDEDGADLHVLLHADEDQRLLELEIIRWLDGPLLRPNWDSFHVSA